MAVEVLKSRLPPVMPQRERFPDTTAELGFPVSASRDRKDPVEVLASGGFKAWAEAGGAPWTAQAATTIEAMGNRAVATQDAAFARALAEGAKFKLTREDRDLIAEGLWAVAHEPTDAKALAQFFSGCYVVALRADAATALRRQWRSAAAKKRGPLVTFRARRPSLRVRVRAQSRRVRRRRAARGSPGRSSRGCDDRLGLPRAGARGLCGAGAETRGISWRAEERR